MSGGWLLLLVLALLAPSAIARCSLIGYAQDYKSKLLYSVNLTSNTITPIGIIEDNSLNPIQTIGLAMTTNLVLYANTETDLYSVNVGTGRATLIGPFGVEVDYLVANGATLLGVSGNGIYTVNINTGAASLIVVPSTALVFIDAAALDGPNTLFLVPNPGLNFYTIDLTTGLVTMLGLQTINPDFILGASLACNGIIYGATNGGDIGPVDPLTGQLTPVISDSSIDWFDFAVQPASVSPNPKCIYSVCCSNCFKH